jgi:hypothetical protein
MTRVVGAVELTNALAERGLLPAGSEPPSFAHTDRPWFISAVLGATGWLAGVFALLFVYLLFEPQSAGGFALAGVIMLVAAYGLYFADRDSAFFDQLALALSIAGQLALAWAAADATDSTAATAALLAVLQLVLLFVLPNQLAKTLAAFFACVAWAIAVRYGWWDRSAFDYAREDVALLPALLGWLVIWVPLIAAAQLLITREAEWMASALRGVARPALNGLVGALAIATWVSEPFASLPFWTTGTQTNWLALWPLLAAGTALFAAGCAFRLRGHALLGVAIAGALLHTMQFYYVLGTTLLLKSWIMLAVGAALLAAAWALQRRWSPAAGGTP